MAKLGEARLFPLTIPNGAAVSNFWRARDVYEDAEEIVLHAPTVLDALTFTIQVTDNIDAAVVVWRTLQSGSAPADVNAPAATKSLAFSSGVLSSDAIRIASSGNVAA